ncbi:hypothetical protein HDU96_002519 [Phlyctochytrium bullatum]|nr:hypothetical protein HDU96_002519 [Phlyctochytrium bullatum]
MEVAARRHEGLSPSASAPQQDSHQTPQPQYEPFGTHQSRHQHQAPHPYTDDPSSFDPSAPPHDTPGLPPSNTAYIPIQPAPSITKVQASSPQQPPAPSPNSNGGTTVANISSSSSSDRIRAIAPGPGPTIPPAPPAKSVSLPLLLPHPPQDMQRDRPAPLIYSAVYSGVPVYEMMCKNVPIMRRISDGYINATQILRVAGFNKPRRTKILEKEVMNLEHEKVQGGYGKYQGTWIPRELARDLARRYRVEEDLQPIIEFEDRTGELLTKPEYLTLMKGLPSGFILPPPSQAPNGSPISAVFPTLVPAPNPAPRSRSVPSSGSASNASSAASSSASLPAMAVSAFHASKKPLPSGLNDSHPPPPAAVTSTVSSSSLFSISSLLGANNGDDEAAASSDAPSTAAIGRESSIEQSPAPMPAIPARVGSPSGRGRGRGRPRLHSPGVPRGASTSRRGRKGASASAAIAAAAAAAAQAAQAAAMSKAAPTLQAPIPIFATGVPVDASLRPADGPVKVEAPHLLDRAATPYSTASSPNTLDSPVVHHRIAEELPQLPPPPVPAPPVLAPHPMPPPIPVFATMDIDNPPLQGKPPPLAHTDSHLAASQLQLLERGGAAASSEDDQPRSSHEPPLIAAGDDDEDDEEEDEVDEDEVMVDIGAPPSLVPDLTGSSSAVAAAAAATAAAMAVATVKNALRTSGLRGPPGRVGRPPGSGKSNSSAAAAASAASSMSLTAPSTLPPGAPSSSQLPLSALMLPSTGHSRRILTREQRQQEVLLGIFMDLDPMLVVSLLREPFPLNGPYPQPGPGGFGVRWGPGGPPAEEPEPFAKDAHTKWGLGPVNVDMPMDDRGRTALHWAAAFGKRKVVRALMAAGANAYAVSNAKNAGISPFAQSGDFGAESSGSATGYEEGGELGLHHHANLEDAHTLSSLAGGNRGGDEGVRASAEVADEKPSEPTATDVEMQDAAVDDVEEESHSRKEASVPPMTSLATIHSGEAMADRGGEVPLLRAVTSYACYENQSFPEILSYLEQSIRAANHDGHTILHRIAERSGYPGQGTSSLYYLKCVKDWIDKGGFQRMAAVKLHAAAARAAAAAALQGLDPTQFPVPPPISAAPPTVHHIEAEAARITDALLNAQDDYGETALHLAVRSKCRPVVYLLLRMGSSRDIAAYDGTTVYDLAEEGSKMMALLRMGGGANTDAASDLFSLAYARGASPALSEASVAPLPHGPADEALRVAKFQIQAARGEIEELRLSKQRMSYLQAKAEELRQRVLGDPAPQVETAPQPPSSPFLAPPPVPARHGGRSGSMPPPQLPKTASMSVAGRMGALHYGYHGNFAPAISSPLTVASVPRFDDDDDSSVSHASKGGSLSADPGPGQLIAGGSSTETPTPAPSIPSFAVPGLTVTAQTPPPGDHYGAEPSDATDMQVSSSDESNLSRPQNGATPIVYRSVMDSDAGPSSSPESALQMEYTMLQQRYEASIRSHKRMFEEVDEICTNRADKDRRYKRLMAVACNIPVEKVDELLHGPL